MGQQSDGGSPIVLASCYGIATVVLPWASRCPWEHYRSNTVALPLYCRGVREMAGLCRTVLVARICPQIMGYFPDFGVTAYPAGTYG